MINPNEREETIIMLNVLLASIEDKLQGERDNRTVLENTKPSSTEFVLKSAIKLLINDICEYE